MDVPIAGELFLDGKPVAGLAEDQICRSPARHTRLYLPDVPSDPHAQRRGKRRTGADRINPRGKDKYDLDHTAKTTNFVAAASMNRLWQILALMLMALMVPASACCLIPQQVDDIACGCCSAPDQDHDAPAQPKSCPSDTIAHSQLPAAVALPEMQLVELVAIIHAWIRLHELTAQEATQMYLPTTAPPELQTTWVFVSRAALPARAPSELA